MRDEKLRPLSEGGGVVRDEKLRPLSEGIREEENPTHTPPTPRSILWNSWCAFTTGPELDMGWKRNLEGTKEEAWK